MTDASNILGECTAYINYCTMLTFTSVYYMNIKDSIKWWGKYVETDESDSTYTTTTTNVLDGKAKSDKPPLKVRWW